MGPSFTVKDILRLEVAPALGCTEPVAVALCAASAASLVKNQPIKSLEISVDPNLYKNGLAVLIPGTNGLSGLDTAAALGALGGDPALRMEVLAPIDEAVVTAAGDLLRKGAVKVHLLENYRGLYVKTTLATETEVAEAVIQELHDNLVELTLDGQPVKSPLLATERIAKSSTATDLSSLEAWLKERSLSELIELVDDLDIEDLTFLEEGISYNRRLAEYGLKYGSGLGIGKALDRLVRQRLLRNDMVRAARILTSAASDARMAGVNLPAMSSAGSGNHGLTAILPIWAVKDYIDCDHASILKAVGLSHIITAYIKAHTGRLSAVCGCSIAAGAGAAAGVAYLMGGTIGHIAGAIKNVAEDLAGVICDGAKSGCSLKLATAAGNAVQAALFSIQGVNVLASDGIIANTPEKTMQNLGTLSTQGMIETDRTILKIMLEKKFSDV